LKDVWQYRLDPYCSPAEHALMLCGVTEKLASDPAERHLEFKDYFKDYTLLELFGHAETLHSAYAGEDLISCLFQLQPHTIKSNR